MKVPNENSSLGSAAQIKLAIHGGTPSGWPNAVQFQIFGDEHLGHCDAVIISLAAFLKELTGKAPAHFESLTAAQRNIALHQIAKMMARLRDIEKLRKLGTNILVLIDSAIEADRYPFGWATQIDLQEVPIIGRVTYQNLSGTDTILSEAFENAITEPSLSLTIRYVSKISAPDLTPIVIAAGRPNSDKNIVGGIVQADNDEGCIAFLPAEFYKTSGATKVPNIEKEIFADLLSAIAKLSKKVTQDALPGWLKLYDLAPEFERTKQLNILREQLASLESEVLKHTQTIHLASWKKRLIVETDAALEHAIKQFLSEIGIACESGPPKQADIVAKIGDCILVIEAKGYGGAARSQALDQCGRWVGDIRAALTLPPEERGPMIESYVEILGRLGVTCPVDDSSNSISYKGLVIANTYRATPLHDRPSLAEKFSQHFGDDLQERAKNEGIALITTCQLLGLLAGHEEDSKNTAGYLDQLLATNGAYEEFRNWHNYILQHAPPATDEQPES